MKDRIKTEGIDVVYCPTAEMLADFFTNPLQGSLFEKFRRVIMGEVHIDTFLSRQSLVSDKERVGDQVFAKLDNIKDGVVVSGTNGQTAEGITEGNSEKKVTYASVLKRPGRTISSNTVTVTSGKSGKNSPIECSHSIG